MKHILLAIVAISIAHISASTAYAQKSFVGIFGTNSSQTNFVIPAGDSVYVARWLNQTDGDGNLIGGKATATISSITRSVSNSIVFVGGKPRIASVTNSITNSCNFILNDAQALGIVFEGILIPGPASISTTSIAFQYKYFPKRSPYQVLIAKAGTTSPPSINIPAGQKLHQIDMISGYNDNYGLTSITGAKINGFDLGGNWDMAMEISGFGLGLTSEVYGPATLSFTPMDPQVGLGADFYFSYILINSDATNIPITTP
jgi:hypothetical protein